MNYLAPSILAADFTCLGEQVKRLEEAGAHYVHIDVMDGMFVPSISFGMPVIRTLRPCTELKFDVHLMIEEPSRYLEEFAACGADRITVHAEACRHLDRTLDEIRRLGVRASVALNPATDLGMLEYVLPKLDMVLIMTVNPGLGGQKFIPYTTDKIRRLRCMIEEKGLQTDIEVDGGITLENVRGVLEAGANVIVAGSAVFQGDVGKNVKAFLERMGKSYEEKAGK